MIRRKKGALALQELIAAKVRASNSAAKLLDDLKNSELINRLIALRGTIFSKREDSKIRQILADFFASEIISIADGDMDKDGAGAGREASARSKLRIEVRKWLMEQYAPDLYATKHGVKKAEAIRGPSPKIYLPENGRP
ncbi:MAG: hypothetical protein JJ879_10605 [Sneathiella sp.]|nr:hypothetical protein [Sneathiella sp.]